MPNTHAHRECLTLSLVTPILLGLSLTCLLCSSISCLPFFWFTRLPPSLFIFLVLDCISGTAVLCLKRKVHTYILPCDRRRPLALVDHIYPLPPRSEVNTCIHVNVDKKKPPQHLCSSHNTPLEETAPCHVLGFLVGPNCVITNRPSVPVIDTPCSMRI